MIHQRIVPSLLFAAAAFAATSTHASIMNGDFSATNPFEGWTGFIQDCDDDTCNSGNDIDVTDFTAFPNNIGMPVDGKVTISTSWETDRVYAVQLSQTFRVQDLVPGDNGIRLEMFLGFDPSDPTEFGIAQLSDPNGILDTIDLLAGERDITAYAGQQAEILFRIEDFDGPVDSMTFGNISVERVPVPAPVLMLALGLGVLGLRRRTR